MNRFLGLPCLEINEEDVQKSGEVEWELGKRSRVVMAKLEKEKQIG